MAKEKKKTDTTDTTDSDGGSSEPTASILLVPTDFSPFAMHALRYANELAVALGAELAVPHVIHDPAERPGFYLRDKKQKKKWAKRLETFTEVAGEMMDEFITEAQEGQPAESPIFRAETLFVRGTVVTRLLEVAKKIGATMIVVGSHGRTGARRLLLGSKASKTVQLSPIPVTVVKLPTEPTEN